MVAQESWSDKDTVTKTRDKIRADAIAAADLARRMPLITIEARRVSAAVSTGLHGRGRAGPGENFWQYRPLIPGESAARIDWRRSARHDGHWFVREREWDAARTVHLFIDRSESMAYASGQGPEKRDRALIIGLALAELLVRAGERVSVMGVTEASASRGIIDRLAEALVMTPRDDLALPPATPLSRHSIAVLIGDFITEPETVERCLASLSSSGARGVMVRIMDPAEALFPFSGDLELVGMEEALSKKIGDASSFRKTALEALETHEQALHASARRYGFSYHTHLTDQTATQILFTLMQDLARRDGTMTAARHG